jgi:hypothetical protein
MFGRMSVEVDEKTSPAADELRKVKAQLEKL